MAEKNSNFWTSTEKEHSKRKIMDAEILVENGSSELEVNDY